ncbi:SusC/RagA family TonB-linked outer membrane protein [Tunicatimonas pelagia]|uniref:SusC/RagA family TonB-linked outer membrane protein n=1 Tax=Tunicatimonas pelagia TaxID=931531 RepID=UPI0026658711|nr:TonB-dependent receptor [Tunicatimonas pelagia]WKN43675.1 TonB-dependent receptor [Tunicatimonas pelagia]
MNTSVPPPQRSARLIALLFLFLATFSASAQELAAHWTATASTPEQTTAQSLKQTLFEIEKKHDIKITYQSDLVNDKTIDIQQAQRLLSVSKNQLEGTIHQLVKPMGLQFRQFQADYYILQKRAKLPKVEKKSIQNTTSPDQVPPVVSRSFSQWKASRQRYVAVITGTITDLSDNSTLPGVNVIIKGTSTGTVTDLDGKYRIEASPEDTLSFSSVGYETEDIYVGNQTIINVAMAPSITSLSEIVVVGYGTQEEKDLTSAISTVDAEEIQQTPTAQAMQALQGRVAGVQIVSNGAPGASPTVRVRGVGSFEGNAAPLYVVDGMFFDNIDFLNPNDIETLSVLKDASASAIYGVRAANGVVLIETKSGDYEQAPEIVYDGYYGIQNPQNVLQMANTEQFVRYVNETGSAADIEFVDNAIQRFGQSSTNPGIPNVNTDWYDVIMEPASIQNHTLSFNGGGAKTRYSIGGSYFNQQGLLKSARNDFTRLNFRTKLDSRVKDWLTVGGNFNVSTSRQFVGENAAWFRGYFAVPILPVYDELNTANEDQLSNAQLIGYRQSQNPLYPLLYNDDRNQTGTVNGNFYGEIDIVPNILSFRSSYNYSLEGKTARNVDFAYADGNQDFLSAIRRNNLATFDQVWDNFLTYENNFGDHFLTVVGGYSYRSEYAELLFVRGEDISPIPSRDQQELWYLSRALNFDVDNIGDATGTDGDNEDIFGNRTINGQLFFQSFFGRVAYNYDDRYLLYTTYRRDGNNKFQQQWGDFFTFGAGWVLSEENFFNANFIDFLKLRGSWGQLGNDNIRPAVGAPTLEETTTAIDGVLVTGRRLRPTFDLIEQWETTEEINIGLTSRLFNERLSVEADYFIRDTENLAVGIIPPVFRDTERRSRGEIRNEGLELSLNWSDNFLDGFSYNIGGNLATLNNEVLSLGGDVQYLNAGSGEFRQRSIIGEPFQAFYGYEVVGVFQDEEQINSSGYTQEFITDNSLEPGDFFFRDQNGDGVVDADDRVVLGSYLPTLNYGFNFGLSYKNFNLTANFQGQTGHQILNRKRGEIIFTNDTNLDAELINNLWRGPGTSNRYPSAAGLRKGWNQNMSDYFVEDGNYFRIQNVRLSYLLSQQPWYGENLPKTRLTLTAERPLTVFNYNGFNPEVNDGIDRQVYPIPAVYTIGLNITL